MAEQTVIAVYWKRVSETPERAAVLEKVNGKYRTVNWRDNGSIAERVSAALIEQCSDPSQKIAITSTSCSRWTWADVGILSMNGVTVPIYPSLNAEEAAYVLEHSETSAVFVENVRQIRKLATLSNLPPRLRYVVLFEGEWTEEFPLPVYTWDEFLKIGEKKLQAEPNCVKDRIAKIEAEHLATIVYTSGTTGVPKGVMLKHENIFYVCKTLAENMGLQPNDLALSFLPLSHIFERVGGQFLSIYCGTPVAYAESMDTVAENIVEVKPTIMNAVPRFYEKAYNRVQSQIRLMPTPQQYFARWALSLGKRAIKAERECSNGKRELVRSIYRTELKVADRFVFRKIRQRFGGKLRFLVSGAAPLSMEVHQFFESIGLLILEGYGLTETTAPIAANSPANNKPGTVGKPLPGVEVKIAEDGEILVRGPNVFGGYFKNEEATGLSFKDGWFMTGDIGDIDSDGYLTIKDRKKDIIITAGGKHVAPQVLENMLAGQGLISRVLVYGDRRKYISALITLNPDELRSFAKDNGIPYSSIEELSQHPAVIASVQKTIDEANARLASFEQIKRFVVLDTDFTIEANELTPTLKLRRKFVTEKFKDLLDGLYEKADILA